MRILILLLLCLMLSACSVQYSVLDTDDTYVMRHYDWNRGSYGWFRYSRPYQYVPRYADPYFNPFWYPQRDVIVVVPKQAPQQNYGKRPDRGGNTVTPQNRDYAQRGRRIN